MLIKKYLEDLRSKGRHSFTTKELKNELGLTDAAVWNSLSRLKRKGKVATPSKGYYIIIPPEYRSLGSLPANHFIDDLMKYWKMPYYVALLSAAQHYGAAHHQPMVFQVMVSKPKRNLRMGRVRVEFIVKGALENVPTKQFNTPCGYIAYSTPEATALDLVAYPKRSAGLGNVITVLAELVEEMDVEIFKSIIPLCKEKPALQRLGYLFELNCEAEFAAIVYDYLSGVSFEKVVLEPRSQNKQGDVNKKWRLIINEQLESEV